MFSLNDCSYRGLLSTFTQLKKFAAGDIVSSVKRLKKHASESIYQLAELIPATSEILKKVAETERYIFGFIKLRPYATLLLKCLCALRLFAIYLCVPSLTVMFTHLAPILFTRFQV